MKDYKKPSTYQFLEILVTGIWCKIFFRTMDTACMLPMQQKAHNSPMGGCLCNQPTHMQQKAHNSPLGCCLCNQPTLAGPQQRKQVKYERLNYEQVRKMKNTISSSSPQVKDNLAVVAQLLKQYNSIVLYVSFQKTHN